MFFSHNNLRNIIRLEIGIVGQDKAILLCYAFTNSRVKIKRNRKFCADSLDILGTLMHI